MLTTLLNSPAATAPSIVVVVSLNYVLIAMALRDESRQHMLKRVGPTSGAASDARRRSVELVQPFLMATVVIGRSRRTPVLLVAQIDRNARSRVRIGVHGRISVQARLRPDPAAGEWSALLEGPLRSAAGSFALKMTASSI